MWKEAFIIGVGRKSAVGEGDDAWAPVEKNFLLLYKECGRYVCVAQIPRACGGFIDA